MYVDNELSQFIHLYIVLISLIYISNLMISFITYWSMVVSKYM